MRRIVILAVICSLVLVSCENSQNTDTQRVKIEKTAKKKVKKSARKPSEKKNDPQVYKEALKAEITDVNGKLPVQVEPGVTVTKFTVEGNDAVYYYMCDENVVNMNALRQSQEKMKTGTFASLKTTRDPETLHLLMMLRKGAMGLTYKYVGVKTGETILVQYNPEEIKGLKSE